MKKMITLLLLLIPLSGCIPAAIVAGATAGGAIIYDKRSIGTILKDRHAAQTAQNTINRDRWLKGRSHISVAVFNQIALMVGQAQTAALRKRAFNIVENTKGVKRVYNEVRIEGPISTIQATNDAWITTKVKTAMLATKGLSSTQIKAVTENGVVYLMGEVSHQQGNLAANVARQMSGVLKVVKVFQYLT